MYNKRRRKCLLAIAFATLLFIFFMFNISAAFMIARIRYVTEPPGINCATVVASSEFNVLQEKAFIEYKEQQEFSHYDYD